jgi:hypothetical protein
MKTLVILVLTVELLSGCGSDPTAGWETANDQQVQRSFANQKTGDAIASLERGLTYIDQDEPGEQKLDKPVVLPLLKRLKQEFGLDWQAAISKGKDPIILNIYAKLPSQDGIREKIEAALDREQKTFPGAILQAWGNDYLSLEFQTEETAEFFEKEEAKADAKS